MFGGNLKSASVRQREPGSGVRRPSAASPAVVGGVLIAGGMDRGARCTDDFTLVDHLAMVDEPLDDVRRRYGVPPRER